MAGLGDVSSAAQMIQLSVALQKRGYGPVPDGIELFRFDPRG